MLLGAVTANEFGSCRNDWALVSDPPARLSCPVPSDVFVFTDTVPEVTVVPPA